MFQTILVATDGSDHANRAAAIASDLASKYGSRIVFLHVLMHGNVPDSFRRMAEIEHMVPESPVTGPTVGNVPANIAAALRQEKQAGGSTMELLFQELGERITQSARHDAATHGVADAKITTAVEEGDPVERILEAQKREQADLIVLGSRGLGNMKGLLLGSVSHKVAHLAECACLTVK